MTSDPFKKGELIGIFGAKGGIGRTVIATNLAVALSLKKEKTIILDGSFQFGNIHLAMDIRSKFTIKDVVEQIETLNMSSLPHYLSHHESGVSVLPAPPRPEYADLITSHSLDKICELLLEDTDYLLVDTPPGFSEHNLYFLEKANHILLVTDLGMGSLKNTKEMLHVLDTLGLRKKVKVIVNRSNMESVLQTENIPHILEETSLLYIPNYFQLVSKSLNLGVPFLMNHRRSKISKSFLDMAGQFSKGEHIPSQGIKIPSFIERILRKTKGPKE